MRVQVASVSGAYNPEIFCEMINEQVATSKFSAAVENTMANPQDPDREILYATDQEMRGFASATHYENRKGVSLELVTFFVTKKVFVKKYDLILLYHHM